jgi:hypothetical protein
MGLVPQLSLGKIQGALLSPEILAVGSAILFSSVLAGHLTGFISQLPILKDHVIVGLILISVVIILIAIKMKGGSTFRAIAVGLAGGTFFIALLQIPTVARTVGQITSLVR